MERFGCYVSGLSPKSTAHLRKFRAPHLISGSLKIRPAVFGAQDGRKTSLSVSRIPAPDKDREQMQKTNRGILLANDPKMFYNSRKLFNNDSHRSGISASPADTGFLRRWARHAGDAGFLRDIHLSIHYKTLTSPLKYAIMKKYKARRVRYVARSKTFAFS